MSKKTCLSDGFMVPVFRSVAAGSYKNEYVTGGAYSVESPVISGFTAVPASVEGTMPDKDLTESVVYYEASGYTVVSGGDASLTEGKLSSVIITVKRDKNDRICFDLFDSVSIDGKKLSESTDYTAAAGSTVITLSESLLETLSTGTHMVDVDFIDGSAETTLTIISDSEPDPPVPDTGADGNMDLWNALMIMSSYGLVSAVRKRRKMK